MPTGRTSWKRGRATVLAAAAALAMAGCGTGSADLMSPATRPAASAGSASPGTLAASGSSRTPGTAPLTGLPVASGGAADRAAVAVPVAGDQPQGLSAADVVFEEITSPMRYIAVFQSHEDSSVGPVMATRPTDAQVLSVLHPLTTYDGGTTSFIRVLDKTEIVDLGYLSHPSLYHPGAQGPTVSTSQIQHAARDGAPPQLFTYQGNGVSGVASFASTGAWRTSTLRITAPGHATQTWAFDAHTDRWSEVAGGPPVQVANIVVQSVRYKTVFLSRRYGLTVPSARVIGSGPALVLSEAKGSPAAGHSGVAVKATWSKPGLHEVTDYLDPRGTPVGFQRGTTWVILAPPGTQTSTAGSRP